MNASPNADEALSLLGIPRPVTKEKIEDACAALLEDCESVIIRSGALGAYTQTRAKPFGQWVDAFFLEKDAERVKDVTGKIPEYLWKPISMSFKVPEMAFSEGCPLV
jgi:hypothetical protein